MGQMTSEMTIKFVPSGDKGKPGKLADAELCFSGGPLAGLKLIGFGVWERRGGRGRNVTFPARVYNVDAERRSYALLRPMTDAMAIEPLRNMILDAFDAYEATLAVEV